MGGNTASDAGEEVAGMSGIAVFWIAVAATCCGLCIYGISRAVRRSKKRRDANEPVLTHR